MIPAQNVVACLAPVAPDQAPSALQAQYSGSGLTLGKIVR